MTDTNSTTLLPNDTVTGSNDLVSGFKSATKKGSADKRPYVLDEVLCIMAMFRSGMKPKQVSELTGRSVHTLRYKFLEGEIELNGEKTIRSVKRFGATSEIYTHYKVEVPADIDADVKARIEGWKAKLSETIVAPAAEPTAVSTEAVA